MAIANLRLLEAFTQTIDYVSTSRDIHINFLKDKYAFTRKSKLAFSRVTYLILSLLKKVASSRITSLFLQT